MSNFIAFSTCMVVALATTTTREKKSLQPPAHNFGNFVNHNTKRYASNAELTSLAYSSALQASTAVQNQQTAASHAAFQAKSNLAQAALGAAATAQAALVGKQVIVQNLKVQLQDAEKQLQAMISQYHQLQQVAAASFEAAKQAQLQVNALTNFFSATRASAKKTLDAATGVSALSTNQHEMIQKAKEEVTGLTQQLYNALGDMQDVDTAAKSVDVKLEADDAHSAATSATNTTNVVVTESKMQEIFVNSTKGQN